MKNLYRCYPRITAACANVLGILILALTVWAWAPFVFRFGDTGFRLPRVVVAIVKCAFVLVASLAAPVMLVVLVVVALAEDVVYLAQDIWFTLREAASNMPQALRGW